MSPTSSHVSVAVFINDPELYCTLNFSFESADPMVTPLPWAMVVCPAPMEATFTTVPTGKATELFGGTVRVFAEAFDIVTSFPASVRARV